MPPKYNTKLIGTKKIGKATKKSYQVTKKENFKTKDIKDILATVSKHGPNAKIMIRALNADKWNTLITSYVGRVAPVLWHRCHAHFRQMKQRDQERIFFSGVS